MFNVTSAKLAIAIMREQLRGSRQAEDFDYVEDDELPGYLEELAPSIGWVIIYFNSLEDSVAYCLRDLMLRDPFQDERLDVFLCEMLFAAKSRALIHLYGQIAENWGINTTHTQVAELEALLLECAKRRNEYAHADWIGMTQGPIVRVKSQSKMRGIVHRYKRFAPTDVEEDVKFINAARHTLDEFHERVLDQIYGRTPAKD